MTETRSPKRMRPSPSAIWLRAELATQRNRMLLVSLLMIHISAAMGASAAHVRGSDSGGGRVSSYIDDIRCAAPAASASKTSDQRSEATERVRLDAIADPRAVDVAADEPRLFEHLEVLRNRRLSERQLVHQIPANAAIFADQNAQDLHTSRVPERFGECRQFLVGRVALDGPKISLQFGRRAARLGAKAGRTHRRYTIGARRASVNGGDGFRGSCSMGRGGLVARR